MTVKFTSTVVDGFICPPDKSQAFLWDSAASGLGLRATAGGSTYVFQARLGGQSLRITIGRVKDLQIADARKEARRLQGMVDKGVDPRQDKADSIAQGKAQREAAKLERAKREVTGLQAWLDYCDERKPRWGERNHADHLKFASEGGSPRQRGEGLTRPGILHPLLARPLSNIDDKAVLQWVNQQTTQRTALAFRCLRAFINWCSESDAYDGIVQADACKPRKVKEALPVMTARSDALQKEQLAAWFKVNRAHGDPVVSAYLQTLLLLGARPNEVLSLQWEDLNFQWKTISIKDKVEGVRTIPLPAYVSHLLASLPRRNQWVFSSAHPKSQDGRLSPPREHHAKALASAGIDHVTLHGLRRSFGTLSEWVECPVGVVAQIQGHKPSAVAEKHYRARPIDLLRVWHQRIEDWMLEQGQVEFSASTQQRLHVVAG